jgi:adenylate kinase family enzyme
MKKVLVIGSGGAGKSILASRLGGLLKIPVLHLDRFYWRSGWIEPPKDQWVKTVDGLLRQDAWIMDGNYSGTLAMRVDASDTVIFLDLPRVLCVWRVLKRALIYRNDVRPDMAEGCREKLNWEFISWVWNYSTRSRPKIMQLLRSNSERKKIVWLRSSSEVESFLARLATD